MVDFARMRRIPISSSRASAVLLVLLALPGLACEVAGDSVFEPVPGPTVILISMDGTRPVDVLGAGLAPFEEIARRGAVAEALVPVFPSNTFPNHASLVTGVRPATHGIVNNVFRDPERGLHRYENDPTWLQAEPLWSWAAAHGVVSAAYHWVGSEGAWTSGRGPREWKRFDSGVPERDKVDQILAWLDREDPRERPRLVTAWFRGADRPGHAEGPGSAAVQRMLREQMPALEALLRGLDQRAAWSDTTLLIVSDHGMAPVGERIFLQQALDERDLDAEVLGAGGFASVAVREPSRIPAVVAVARELGLEAWARSEAPPELHVENPRFGEVVVLAPPFAVVDRKRFGVAPMRGSHGYRPELPEMGALLAALGRGAPAGAELGSLRSLDVAPTVLALLGVPAPDWMEGAPIRPLLSELGAPVGTDTLSER